MIKIIFLNILAVLLFTSPLNASIKKSELDITMSLISTISETVHSLQQERGASCGYISSNGSKFEEKLKSIKNKSDKRIAKLDNLLKTNKSILNKIFSSKQHKVLDSTFNELYIIRDNVRDLQIDFTKTYSKSKESY